MGFHRNVTKSDGWIHADIDRLIGCNFINIAKRGQCLRNIAKCGKYLINIANCGKYLINIAKRGKCLIHSAKCGKYLINIAKCVNTYHILHTM